MKSTNKNTEPNVKITAYVPASVKAKVEEFGTATCRNLSLTIQYLVESHPETKKETVKKAESVT